MQQKYNNKTVQKSTDKKLQVRQSRLASMQWLQYQISLNTKQQILRSEELKTENNLGVTNLFAGSATVRHGVVGADFTEVAGIDIVITETTIDQPRLVEVRVSCVDVRKFYGNKIFHLLKHTCVPNVYNSPILDLGLSVIFDNEIPRLSKTKHSNFKDHSSTSQHRWRKVNNNLGTSLKEHSLSAAMLFL